MNRYVLNTIFSFTVFSLCGMEENSGGSAGKSQSIFSMDTLLAPEQAIKATQTGEQDYDRIRESWRQVTSAGLLEIAERLDLPYDTVYDASRLYKNNKNLPDILATASREDFQSAAEKYSRKKEQRNGRARAERAVWDEIRRGAIEEKAREVGVSFETALVASRRYRTNEKRPSTFWKASKQELEKKAAANNRLTQEARKEALKLAYDKGAAALSLELQTSGEQQ